jgi:hypothetical protein
VKKVLIALAVLLLGFVGFVASRPGQFKLTRATTIAARPELVYAEIADFHRWNGWSPWDKIDPAMKREFSGPTSGVGAKYVWTGNDEVGTGSMEIVRAEAPTSVTIDLRFLEPFAQQNETLFSVRAKDGGSEVDWTMSGANNFMSKAYGVFVDVDAMVGGDFEKGLASLKVVAEAAEKKQLEAEAAAKVAAEAEAAAKAAADAAHAAEAAAAP